MEQIEEEILVSLLSCTSPTALCYINNPVWNIIDSIILSMETLSKIGPSAPAISFILTISLEFIFFALQLYKLSHNIIEELVYLYLSFMTGMRIFSKVPLYYMTEKVQDGRLVLVQILSFIPAAYFTVIIAKCLLCCIRSCCTSCRRYGYTNLDKELQGQD